jgi:hypothetical protein
MILDVYISAVKVGVPMKQLEVAAVITTINTLLADDFPVDIAPYEYDEFVDKDRLGPEYGYINPHDAFDNDQFADAVSDLWTTVTLLHRNGVNAKVRNLQSFLDQFILGTDCVDAMDSLDL